MWPNGTPRWLPLHHHVDAEGSGAAEVLEMQGDSSAPGLQALNSKPAGCSCSSRAS